MKDSKNVSLARIEWQKHHQDAQNLPNIQFGVVLDLSDHPDGDQIT